MKLIILFTFILIANAAKLPSYYKKCKRGSTDFDQCLISNAEAGLKNLADEGDVSLKLPNLKPIKVKTVNIQATPQLTVKLFDAEFSGFDNLKFTHISFTDDEFIANVSMPHFTMNSNYDIKGRILILPIVGHGTCTINADKIGFSYVIKLKKEKRKESTYYQVESDKLKVSPEKIVWQFNNLFNGDKALGENMNKFLNENWWDVYQEVEHAISEVLKSIFHNYIVGHLNRIPIGDIIE